MNAASPSLGKYPNPNLRCQGVENGDREVGSNCFHYPIKIRSTLRTSPCGSLAFIGASSFASSDPVMLDAIFWDVRSIRQLLAAIAVQDHPTAKEIHSKTSFSRVVSISHICSLFLGHIRALIAKARQPSLLTISSTTSENAILDTRPHILRPDLILHSSYIQGPMDSNAQADQDGHQYVICTFWDICPWTRP